MINQLIKSFNFEFLSKTYLRLSSSVQKTLQERLHSQTFYQWLKSKAASYCMAKDWNCTSSQKVCPCSLQFKHVGGGLRTRLTFYVFPVKCARDFMAFVFFSVLRKFPNNVPYNSFIYIKIIWRAEPSHVFFTKFLFISANLSV